MTRTSIVVRPMAVRPVSTGPTQAKCSSQISWRGWNSRVNNPVSGSRPPIFGPLWRLSFRQDNAKFSATVGPWCCSAMTWSIWKGRTSSDCGSRQYSQALRRGPKPNVSAPRSSRQEAGKEG